MFLPSSFFNPIEEWNLHNRIRSKQVLKNYYNKIDIYMLNNYHNFVCDKNSYTNKINFV